jgi:hypothetical protein
MNEELKVLRRLESLVRRYQEAREEYNAFGSAGAASKFYSAQTSRWREIVRILQELKEMEKL